MAGDALVAATIAGWLGEVGRPNTSHQPSAAGIMDTNRAPGSGCPGCNIAASYREGQRLFSSFELVLQASIERDLPIDTGHRQVQLRPSCVWSREPLSCWSAHRRSGIPTSFFMTRDETDKRAPSGTSWSLDQTPGTAPAITSLTAVDHPKAMSHYSA
jgi:hypothetical protein